MAKPPVPAVIRRDCRGYVADHDWVYRYWDRDETLLYVGISTDAYSRAISHRNTAKWWRFVAGGEAWLVPNWISVVTEHSLIQTDLPLFNVVHSAASDVDTVLYCARREAWDLVDDLLDIIRFGDDPAGQLVREYLPRQPTT